MDECKSPSSVGSDGDWGILVDTEPPPSPERNTETPHREKINTTSSDEMPTAIKILPDSYIPQHQQHWQHQIYYSGPGSPHSRPGSPNFSSRHRGGGSPSQFSSKRGSPYGGKKNLGSPKMKGLASSHSFNELAHEIELAMTLGEGGDSNPDLANYSRHSPYGRNGGSASPAGFSRMKSSPTYAGRRGGPSSIFQHSQQQQQQQQQHLKLWNAHVMSPMSFLPPTSNAELIGYCIPNDSRALIIIHSAEVDVSFINDICKKYGNLYYLRQDFHMRGVTFVGFFDLRSATLAKAGIVSDFGTENGNIEVHFSIMLEVATNIDESCICISPLPSSQTKDGMETILLRHGAIRQFKLTEIEEEKEEKEVVIKKKTEEKTGEEGGGGEEEEDTKKKEKDMFAVVEYYNINDARIAFSELSKISSHLWNTKTQVFMAPLQPCLELWQLLSRWKEEQMSMMLPMSMYSYPPQYGGGHYMMPSFGNMYSGVPVYPQVVGGGGGGGGGLDGGDIYTFPVASGPPSLSSVDEGIGGGGGGVSYQHQYQHQQQNGVDVGTVDYSSQYVSAPQYSMYGSGMMEGAGSRMSGVGIPMHRQDGSVYLDKSQYGRSQDTGFRGARGEGTIKYRGGKNPGSSEMDFSLDLIKIADGSERRTTLMIRNIPNKYTQITVLEAINERHKGLYDFFYLPIDFKNKCNVGYAFINFIEPGSVAAFYEEFNGSRWKNFNSEKICALTFARIQGKSAMVSRFQNSSVLDKDDSYRPLLFYSLGPEQGQPEPFPDPDIAPPKHQERGDDM